MDHLSSSTAGIETYQPAILFAALYALLACLYVWKTSRNPTYVVLVVFCIFRIVGFILRAILAASDGAKRNVGIVIAETVFFALGFVSLLYCVFMLVSNRMTAAQRVLGEDENHSSGWILDLILSRGLTDMNFTAAAGVSIAAAAYIASNWAMSDRLRKVSTILYLEITIIICIQAVVLMYKEYKASRLGLGERGPAGQTHAVYLYCSILLLLLIRQAYLLGTFDSDRRNDERLWYPLFAMPEFVAACLFSVPGLVPRSEEQSEEDKKRPYWSRLWRAYKLYT